MRQVLAGFCAVGFMSSAGAMPSMEVVCTYAPSQSTAVAAISGASAGGAAATAGAMATATGLTAVAHSSGALILTGSSGYIAGTLGASATAVAAAPFIVAVGVIAGGSAVTLELVCASKNHPDQVAKVTKAAEDFAVRLRSVFSGASGAVNEEVAAVKPMAAAAAVKVKQIAGDVWAYAYRRTSRPWASTPPFNPDSASR